jgi:hypothetical protein
MSSSSSAEDEIVRVYLGWGTRVSGHAVAHGYAH